MLESKSLQVIPKFCQGIRRRPLKCVVNEQDAHRVGGAAAAKTFPDE